MPTGRVAGHGIPVPAVRWFRAQASEVLRAARDGHRPREALHGDDEHVDGRPRDRARRGEGSADGQQLRVPRAQPLLRRRHLPPHHQRLRVPGRRSGRHRPGRPRVPLRRRVAEGRPVRDRIAGDGQRRPRHERQSVLPDLGQVRRPAPAAVLAVRQGREGARDRRRHATRATGGGDRPKTDVVINSVTIAVAD